MSTSVSRERSAYSTAVKNDGLYRSGDRRLGMFGDHVLSVELVACKRKGARRRDRAEDLQRLTTCLAHSSPLLIRPAM